MGEGAAHISFRELFERSPDAQLLLEGTRIIEGNRAAVELYGFETREQLLEFQPWEFSPQRQPDGRLSAQKGAEMVATALQRGSHRFEWEHLRPDGERFPVEVMVYAVHRGPPALLHGVIHDVTERKALEARLRQTQRQEAIGNLAGGVAHDFNNILTAFQGYTDLIRLDLEGTAPESVRQHLANIGLSIDRGAALTRQILAFSRKQVLAPQVIAPNRIVEGVRSMLEQLLPNDVELEFALAEDLDCVRVDPSQLELVLVNLILNARDAMPDGGRIRVSTARVRDLDRPEIELAVRDEGIGMDRETIAKVFEPFYSTKDSHSGTGLGLSSVHGIVGQSGGRVEVESAPGRGATFRVLLPAVAQVAPALPRPARTPTELAGNETILLCDDDPQVLAVTAMMLRSRGYRVLEASGAADALLVSREHEGEIELLLTDVVMAGMGGPELAELMTVERPDTRVLFTSGYMADMTLRKVRDLVVGQVLEKPFSAAQLLQRVRGELDAESPSGSA